MPSAGRTTSGQRRPVGILLPTLRRVGRALPILGNEETAHDPAAMKTIDVGEGATPGDPRRRVGRVPRRGGLRRLRQGAGLVRPDGGDAATTTAHETRLQTTFAVATVGVEAA